MTRTRQPIRRIDFKPRDRNTALIAARLNAGKTRRDLARITGVSAESIRLAELGFVPGPTIQFALASYFKTTPLELWPIERQRVAA